MKQAGQRLVARARLTPARGRSDAEVQRSLLRLVLTLLEFLRQLMERQALRRVQKGQLSRAQVEAVGLALLRLERAIRRLARRFGLRAEDLNLELGPLGRLL